MLDGTRIGGCTKNSNRNSELKEAEYKDFQDLEDTTHDAEKNSQQDMIEILLQRDTNAKSPNSQTKVPIEKQENKSISDLLMSVENRRRSDEYRVDMVARNDLTRSRRHDGPRTFTNVPGDREVPKRIKKRVTIHLICKYCSASQGHGKLILLPDSLEELLRVAGKLS